MDKVEYIANNKSFRVYERPFTQKELAFWEQYGISLETLEQYHVKSLSCYESVSREGKPFKLISSSEEPIFCYAHNDFVKIYRPNSKLRFLYGGEKSEEYVFGLAQMCIRDRLRTPPPPLGGREEQVASCRDEKRDDALTVPLRLMQYICCGNKNLAIYKYASNPSAKIRNCCSSEDWHISKKDCRGHRSTP